jgi:hypothetical protein
MLVNRSVHKLVSVLHSTAVNIYQPAFNLPLLHCWLTTFGLGGSGIYVISSVTLGLLGCAEAVHMPAQLCNRSDNTGFCVTC